MRFHKISVDFTFNATPKVSFFFFGKKSQTLFRPTVKASMERSDGATFGTGPVESGGKLTPQTAALRSLVFEGKLLLLDIVGSKFVLSIGRSGSFGIF